ncbi:hypothetical protein FUAX_28280 [Fulvitalea axinellae]|uniref:Nucleoside 2-deoxyribosyltransferase n=1 Tax=Fulvitalea axinellae TaxID=1182444 RepID=A0AAU9CMU6_9BACT|nr:hypothetical protein FUAX_28280 [Fulvitalea axinellae]
MKLLIHFFAKGDPLELPFNPALLKWAKESFVDLTSVDLDNYSGKVLIDYTTKLMDEASKIVIVVEAEACPSVGGLPTLFERLAKRNNSGAEIMAVVKHEKLPIINRMLKTFDKESVFENRPDGETRDLLRYFLQT